MKPVEFSRPCFREELTPFLYITSKYYNSVLEFPYSRLLYPDFKSLFSVNLTPPPDHHRNIWMIAENLEWK